MKHKSTVVLMLTLLLSASVLITGTAVAQHDWSNKDQSDMDRGRMHDRMMAPRANKSDMHGRHMRGRRSGGINALLRYSEELKLSESQKGQLKNLQFEFQLAQIDQEAAIKKAHIKLKKLMKDSEAPEAEVMEAIEFAAGAKAEMEKMKYSHRRAMLANLTEDQREKLDQLRMDRKARPDSDDLKRKLGRKRRLRSRSGG